MADFQVNNGNTTVSFDYTATTAKIQSVVGDVAENLWKKELNAEGEITNPFADATNQEKLDVIVFS